MLLQIGAQSAPHHLKGNEFPRYAKSLCDGVNLPSQKVLCIPWYSFARPRTATKGRKHQGLGRSVFADAPPSLDDRSNVFWYGDRFTAGVCLHFAFVQASRVSRAVNYQSVPSIGLPLQPKSLARPRCTEQGDAHEAQVIRVLDGIDEPSDLFCAHRRAIDRSRFRQPEIFTRIFRNGLQFMSNPHD